MPCFFLISIFTGAPSNDPVHPDFVPSLFSDEDYPSAKQRLDRYNRRLRGVTRRGAQQHHQEPTPDLHTDSQDTVSVVGDDHFDCSQDSSQPSSSSVHASSSPQPSSSSLLSLEEQLEQQKTLNASMNAYIGSLQEERDAAQEELLRCKFCASIIKDDDKRSQFYTGLSYEVFLKTYEFLSVHVKGKTKDSLPFLEQFFLTLVKLRLDLPFEFLAHLTDCGEQTVRDYFWKWVDLMYAKLKFLIKQPDREATFRTLPPEIKAKFPKLTSIIDCFEIFIDMPGEFVARQQTYSNYKHHTTVKVLIACSPLGAITFISLAWGGRVSDIELVRKSGFICPRRFQPGDQILADRGFPLQDDFAVHCSAELIVPAFTKGKSQLSPEDVETSREKSSVRIHVERVIGTLKRRFTILKGNLPIHMVKTMKDEADEASLASIDRLLTVCAALVNLGGSIVFKG